MKYILRFFGWTQGSKVKRSSLTDVGVDLGVLVGVLVGVDVGVYMRETHNGK